MFDQEIAPLKRTLSVRSTKFNQISKLAKQIKVRPFNARKKFLFAILVVRVMIRLLRLLPCSTGKISVNLIKQDPYRHKIFRKVSKNWMFNYCKNIFNSLNVYSLLMQWHSESMATGLKKEKVKIGQLSLKIYIRLN